MQEAHKQRVTISIGPQILVAVDREAKRTGDSRSAVIEQWLSQVSKIRVADALNHQIEAYYSAQSPEERAEDEAWGELGIEDWSAADKAQPVMRETSGSRHRKRASRTPARTAKR